MTGFLEYQYPGFQECNLLDFKYIFFYFCNSSNKL